MPINQPPISKGDIVRSSWDLEATQLINRLEQLVIAQEQTITTLQGTLGTLRENIESNRGNVTTNTSSINTLNMELDVVEGDIVTLRNDLANAGVVRSVDQSGILNLINGELSSDAVVRTVNGNSGDITITPGGQPVSININNYPVDITSSTTYLYDPSIFMTGDLDSSGDIPGDRHQVFLGGMKLVEGSMRDYTIAGTTITLLPDTMNFPSGVTFADLTGLVLELVIFRL